MLSYSSSSRHSVTETPTLRYWSAFFTIGTLQEDIPLAQMEVLKEKLRNGEHHSLSPECKYTIHDGSKQWKIFGIRLSEKSRVLFMQDQGQFLLLDYLPNHEYETSPFMDRAYFKKFVKNMGLSEAAAWDIGFECPSENLFLGAGPVGFKMTWVDKQKFITLDDQQGTIYNSSTPLIVQGPPGVGKSIVGTDWFYNEIQSAQSEEEQHFAYISKGAEIVDREKTRYQQQAMSQSAFCKVSFIVGHMLYGKDFWSIQNSLGWIGQNLRSYPALQTWSEARVFQEFTLLYAFRGDFQKYIEIRGARNFNAEEMKALALFFRFFCESILETKDSVEGFKWPEANLGRQKAMLIDEGQNFTVPEILALLSLTDAQNIIILQDPKQNQSFQGVETFHILPAIYFALSGKTFSDTILLSHQYRCKKENLEFANDLLRVKYELLGGVTLKGDGLIPIPIDMPESGEVRWLNSLFDLGALGDIFTPGSCEWAIITRPEKVAEAKAFFGGDTMVLTLEQAQGIDLKLPILWQAINRESFNKVPVSELRRIASKSSPLSLSLVREHCPYDDAINAVGGAVTAVTRGSEGVFIIEAEPLPNEKSVQVFFDCIKKPKYTNLTRPCTIVLTVSTREEWEARIRSSMLQNHRDLAREWFERHISSQSAGLAFEQWCENQGLDPAPLALRTEDIRKDDADKDSATESSPSAGSSSQKFQSKISPDKRKKAVRPLLNVDQIQRYQTAFIDSRSKTPVTSIFKGTELNLERFHAVFFGKNREGYSFFDYLISPTHLLSAKYQAAFKRDICGYTKFVAQLGFEFFLKSCPTELLHLLELREIDIGEGPIPTTSEALAQLSTDPKVFEVLKTLLEAKLFAGIKTPSQKEVIREKFLSPPFIDYLTQYSQRYKGLLDFLSIPVPLALGAAEAAPSEMKLKKEGAHTTASPLTSLETEQDESTLSKKLLENSVEQLKKSCNRYDGKPTQKSLEYFKNMMNQMKDVVKMAIQKKISESLIQIQEAYGSMREKHPSIPPFEDYMILFFISFIDTLPNSTQESSFLEDSQMIHFIIHEMKVPLHNGQLHLKERSKQITSNILMHAIMKNHIAIAKIFIEAGFDPLIQDFAGMNALTLAAQSSNCGSLLKAMMTQLNNKGTLAKGLSYVVTQATTEGNALILSLRAQQPRNALILIKAGSDILYQSPLDGATALFLSTQFHYSNLVDQILHRVAEAQISLEEQQAYFNSRIKGGGSVLDLCMNADLRYRDLKIAQKLVAAGADPLAIQSTGMNALLFAAQMPECEELLGVMIRQLEVKGTLAKGLGYALTQPEAEGTALILSLRTQQPQNASILIEAGSDIFYQSPLDGATSLILAGQFHYTYLVELILNRVKAAKVSQEKKQAYLNRRVKGGSTALELALSADLRYRDLQIAQILIAAGADPLATQSTGINALLFAAQTPDCEEQLSAMITQLRATGNLLEALNYVVTQAASGGNALILSLRTQQRQNAKILIEAGSDIFYQSSFDGATALILATQCNYPELVEYILNKVKEAIIPEADKQAYLESRTRGVSTALEIALSADQRYINIAEMLIAAGANPCREHPTGVPGLILAAQAPNCENLLRAMIKKLRDRETLVEGLKYVVTEHETEGNALILSLRTQQPQNASILIEAGSDIFYQSSFDGATALILAAQLGYRQIVNHILNEIRNVSLEQRICALNAQDRDGDTALFAAILGGFFDIAEQLVDAGVEVTHCKILERSPIMRVDKSSHPGLWEKMTLQMRTAEQETDRTDLGLSSTQIPVTFSQNSPVSGSGTSIVMRNKK